MGTVTTVGYGDITPQTTAGRLIAILLMVVGIGFVALITAFVAERFIHQGESQSVSEGERLLLEELREIRERLDHLERG